MIHSEIISMEFLHFLCFSPCHFAKPRTVVARVLFIFYYWDKKIGTRINHSLFSSSCFDSPHKPGFQHSFRDPGNPAWAEHLTWWCNDSASSKSCTLLTNAFDVLIWMRFWKHDPLSWELPGMLGNCQPITLPLLCTVIGWEVALPK